MYNLVAVTVFDSTDNLLEEASSFGFSHLSIVDQVVEKFSTGILEYHDDVLRGGDDSVPAFMQR